MNSPFLNNEIEPQKKYYEVCIYCGTIKSTLINKYCTSTGGHVWMKKEIGASNEFRIEQERGE